MNYYVLTHLADIVHEFNAINMRKWIRTNLMAT